MAPRSRPERKHINREDVADLNFDALELLVLRTVVTWQASTPPLRTPAHSILSVTSSLIRLLHTVLLMIRTSAFCRTETVRPGGQHNQSLPKILANHHFLFFLWRACEGECCRNITSFSAGAPAGDPRLAAGGEVVGGRGQTDGPDVLVEGDVGVQLHQGDVVVIREPVVTGVGDDALHVPLHRPLIGLTLHVQAQEGLPLVGLGVPESKPKPEVRVQELLLVFTAYVCSVLAVSRLVTASTIEPLNKPSDRQ